MKGITIYDASSRDKGIAVGPLDVLPVLGQSATMSRWRIYDLECWYGDGAPELNRLCDTNALVPGNVLLELLGKTLQVIEGRFEGFRSGEDKPWIVVRAVDSSECDVETDDDEVSSRIRASFKLVRDIPSD